jgi:ubiquinone/menaquinone biosynthesis C-methylase UbiE
VRSSGAVNRLHHWYCSRETWKRHVREELVPVAIEGLELGEDVLEVGPGFGPATEALADRAPRVTALEIDPHLARLLRARLAGRAEVVEGDGTAMPFPDASFSAAVCFTMLHHVPSAETQDRLFAEIRRVLQPGAPFAGTDSIGRGIGFALLHIGDTKVPIRPDDLAQRLSAVGLEEVAVATIDRDGYRFRARRPR